MTEAIEKPDPGYRPDGDLDMLGDQAVQGGVNGKRKA